MGLLLSLGISLLLGGAWLLRPRPTSSPARDSLTGLQAKIQRNPRAVEPRLDLAAQYAGAGNSSAAIEQLEAARALGHEDELLVTRLADLYRAGGELEEASEVLAAAARRHPTPTLRAALSKAYLDLGRLGEAAEALETGLSSSATPPELMQRRVQRLLLAGRWEEAGRLTPADATDADWLALKGHVALLTGEAPEAVQALRDAVRQSPRDPWNLYLLGRALQATGQEDATLDAWTAAARLPEAPLSAATEGAVLLAARGKWTEAEALLARVADEGRESPHYWRAQTAIAQHAGRREAEALARGREAYYAGDPWKAEAIYQAAVGPPTLRSADARALFQALIDSAERRFDSRTALAHASQAVSRWPADPSFLRKQAELLLEQDRLAEAQAAANRLQAAAGPEQAAEVTDLQARIALEGGRTAEFQGLAQRGRVVNPRDPNPLMLLAEWEQNAGSGADRLQRALALHRQAVELAPESADAQAGLGSLLSELKLHNEAVSVLHRALTLQPRVLEGVPHVLLSQIHRRQGRSLEAEHHERRYRRLRGLKDAWANQVPLLRRAGSAREYGALGQTALDRHDPWLALCAFQKATCLMPTDPELWRGLAAAERRLGRLEEAMDAMRRSRSLDRPAGARSS